MYIGQKIIKRAPFRWGIVGGGSTSNVGYKHRLGAMRDNTSFVLTAAAFDVDFERGKQFGIDLCMDPDRLYPDYKTMFEEEAKRPDGIEAVDIATPTSFTMRRPRQPWKPACMSSARSPSSLKLSRALRSRDWLRKRAKSSA
jgi:hypothetical protein